MECKGLQFSGIYSVNSSLCLEKEQICRSLYWLIHSESLPHKLNMMFTILLERLQVWLSGEVLV